jgi:hypothetical protein
VTLTPQREQLVVDQQVLRQVPHVRVGVAVPETKPSVPDNGLPGPACARLGAPSHHQPSVMEVRDGHPGSRRPLCSGWPWSPRPAAAGPCVPPAPRDLVETSFSQVSRLRSSLLRHLIPDRWSWRST